MGFPMGQKLVKSGSTWARLCGTHISETTGFIPFEVPWNCLDLWLCNIIIIWPWPRIFKVKFWKCISGMGGPIDTWRKGSESHECWTYVVTFNFDLTHELDLEFSMSKFEITVSQECGGPIDMERKGYESMGCYTYFVTLGYDLDLGFSRSNFENAVSQEWEGRLTWNRRDVSR